MQNVHQLHYNHRLTKEEQEAETMAITTRIAEIVKHSGYSREELADRIGVSSSAITNISGRSRNVTPGMLARISLGIGISVDQLIGVAACDKQELQDLKQRRDETKKQRDTLMQSLSSSAVAATDYDERFHEIQKLHDEYQRLSEVIDRSEALLIKDRSRRAEA